MINEFLQLFGLYFSIEKREKNGKCKGFTMYGICYGLNPFKQYSYKTIFFTKKYIHFYTIYKED